MRIHFCKKQILRLLICEWHPTIYKEMSVNKSTMHSIIDYLVGFLLTTSSLASSKTSLEYLSGPVANWSMQSAWGDRRAEASPTLRHNNASNLVISTTTLQGCCLTRPFCQHVLSSDVNNQQSVLDLIGTLFGYLNLKLITNSKIFRV